VKFKNCSQPDFSTAADESLTNCDRVCRADEGAQDVSIAARIGC
jgi:hypothetical protein